MNDDRKLKFEYYDEAEFFKFLNTLSPKEASKLTQRINNIEIYGTAIATRQQWIKKLDNTDNLFEIRSSFSNNSQRAIYFSFKDGRYVISHGFIKKQQKTPKKEIEKAQQRRKKFKNKNLGGNTDE